MKQLSKHLSAIGVIVASLSFVGLQAQEYVLAWDHPGADHYRVTAEGHPPVVVKETRWAIPAALRMAQRFTVEACNIMGVCTPSAPLVILPPPPPLNLQIGVLGNGIPQNDGEPAPPPPAPSGVTITSPVNGALDVETELPVTCIGTDVSTFTLTYGTTDPPLTALPPSSEGTFTVPGLSTSTVYFIKCVGSNATGSDEDQISVTTAGTPSADLMTEGGDSVSVIGWVTKPLILSQGLATNGIEVYGPSGAVTTQTDVKVEWLDGSMRMGQVTFYASEIGNYNVREDTTPPTGTITPTLPPNTYVEITHYPLGAASSVHRATMPTNWASCNSTWFSGPLMRECRFYVEFDNSPTGYAEHLTVYFNARCFNDGACRIDAQVNNMERSTVVGRGPVPYSVDFRVNNVSVPGFPKGSAPSTLPCQATWTGTTEAAVTCTAHGLTQGGQFFRVNEPGHPRHGHIARILRRLGDNSFAMLYGSVNNADPAIVETIPYVHAFGARWRKTGTYNGFTEAVYAPDLSTLHAAKALPRFLSSISSTALPLSGAGAHCDITAGNSGTNAANTAIGSELDWCWDILGHGILDPWLSATAGREEIGIVPGEYARYLVHKTPALRASVLRQGDLSGSAGKLHIVHPGTESMVDLVDVPTMKATSCTASNCAYGAAVLGAYFVGEEDADHHPSLAYLPYLLTGDQYYAEEMMFWADWGMKGFDSARNGAEGNLVGTNAGWGQAPRAHGWGLRELGNAANYLPDGHEHKSYFATRVQTNIDAMDAVAAEVDPNGDDTFGAMYVGWRQTVTPNMQHVASNWQNAYAALGLHHVIRQGGFTGGTTARNRLVDYIVMLFTSDADGLSSDDPVAYNWYAVGEAPTFTPFATKAELYAFNFSSPPTPARNNAASLTINSCAAFAPEMRTSVVIAASLGRPNAQDALDLLNAQPVLIDTCLANPTYSNAWGKGSQHAIASMP